MKFRGRDALAGRLQGIGTKKRSPENNEGGRLEKKREVQGFSREKLALCKHERRQESRQLPRRQRQVKASWKLISGRITAAAGPEPLSVSGSEVNKALGGALLLQAR